MGRHGHAPAGHGERPAHRPESASRPARASGVDAGRVRVLGAGQARIVVPRGAAGTPAPVGTAQVASGPAPVAAPLPAPASAEPTVVGQLVDAMPAVPDWYGTPSLDERSFPALVLAMLGLFVLITGRGDRRDPKLVRADLDARGREVGFS